MLFPMSEYWSFYLAFTGFVLTLLALDLGVFHKKSHEVTFKEAAGWTVVWISLAMVFNFGLYSYSVHKFGEEIGKQVALEFLTGFVVEKALAVDNIFIFVLVFSFFRVPRHLQHRVLFFGILGALVFRAIFIALGSVLMKYEWVVMLFGAFLIFTGVKMLLAKEEDEKDLSDDPLIRFLNKLIPMTHQYHEDKFFIKDGVKWVATPLFIALLFLEASDIIFAIDSVPAIFALTKEPFIVFTSNIFAILGLRSMYFMLGGVMDKFIYLKHGLALVLMFVGLKMTALNHLYGGKFPITWSLGIIAVLIFGSIGLSLWKTRNDSNISN